MRADMANGEHKYRVVEGRIYDETAPLLARVRIRPKKTGPLAQARHRHPEARPAPDRGARSDTPTYVQHGGADLGIAGMDVLAEHGGEGLYQPVDLGIARCRMVVAVRRGFDYQAAVRQGARLRVATKYVRSTHDHFSAKGVHVDLIRLYGSMELAPLVGLADAIVAWWPPAGRCARTASWRWRKSWRSRRG